jgi:hypothetical protein
MCKCEKVCSCDIFTLYGRMYWAMICFSDITEKREEGGNIYKYAGKGDFYKLSSLMTV